MHICFISSEYPIWKSGGVGSFMQTFSRAMVKRGHTISIVGIGETHEEIQLDDKGVNIYRLPVSKLPAGKFISNTRNINAKIKKLNKAQSINIVESAEMGLVFKNKISSIKYCIRLHGGHHFFSESENRKVHWWQGFKEKLSFKKADGFIAVSEYVKSHTAKYLSYHNKPLEIINYPINTDMFSPDASINVNANNITFAGTICEKKGIRQLIEAMPLLRAKNPYLHLHVYGREWFYKDGSSYTEMLKTKYKSIIEACVTFHGVIPFNDLPKKYAEAMVCVFPSHMETQGLVAPEAMAMKKPVVFSELGPGPETIENYKTGLLCNPHNVDDIVEKVAWFLNNKDKIESIGDNARAFVLHKFNLQAILDKNISFYNRIIKD
ncbi:glycosyltransferase family 4 protein [Winogradskyella sp. UBA3174]|uniref:glycosyltransferase family 4 protein n=1 Tax=Winogradskyella sp. UBA3174 TaxID=1947785 RepID=UPI0025FDF0F1|nr:glycosyltransferase family 4 protein [Winogradskyella sp. UBA3174]|tara:strand:+ start:75070 stop:76206 length:1137 start_codon:yes stop_codon:yes gene_type:complete